MRYCYFCDVWWRPDQWDEHCSTHMRSAIDQDCGIFLVRRLLIKPGFCPFCLVNPLPAPKIRWNNYIQHSSLSRHIRNVHIQVASQWPLPCPMPICLATPLSTPDACEDHLQTIHGIRFAHECVLDDDQDGHLKRHLVDDAGDGTYDASQCATHKRVRV